MMTTRFELLPALYKSKERKDCVPKSSSASKVYPPPFRVAERGKFNDLGDFKSCESYLFDGKSPTCLSQIKKDGFQIDRHTIKDENTSIFNHCRKKQRKIDPKSRVAIEWKARQAKIWQRTEALETRKLLQGLKEEKLKTRIGKLQFAAKQELKRLNVIHKTEKKNCINNSSEEKVQYENASTDSWYASFLQKIEKSNLE